MTPETVTPSKHDGDAKRRELSLFLPYAPEWGDAVLCDERLDQLLAFCRDAQIDAVRFFVNTLRGTYYMPPFTAAEQEHWAGQPHASGFCEPGNRCDQESKGAFARFF